MDKIFLRFSYFTFILLLLVSRIWKTWNIGHIVLGTVRQLVRIVSSNAAANPATISPIIDVEIYVPVVTLSTQDNTETLEQLK